MKKIVLLSMVALFLMGAVAFAATSVPIYSWDASTTNWGVVSNPVIADATSDNTWSTGALSTAVYVPTVGMFMVLPASPTWFKLPTVTWDLHISQWMYISMQYLNYQMHADAPGDYMIDTFTIHAMSNGGVYVYMTTGGPLTNVDNTSPTQTIPTWLGYKVDDQTAPSLGLPSNGNNNGFWYDMNWINNNYGTPAQQLTLYQGGYWEHTLHGWFGFRVDYQTAKGDYTTYADIYIQSDP